jgi:hypothetical protein
MQRRVAAPLGQRPEPVGTDAGIGVPKVIAGEVDVLPADRRRRDRNQIGFAVQLCALRTGGSARTPFAKLTNDGDDDGAVFLGRMPSKSEAAAVRSYDLSDQPRGRDGKAA